MDQFPFAFNPRLCKARLASGLPHDYADRAGWEAARGRGFDRMLRTSGNEKPQLQEGQRARQPASGGRSIEKPNDHRRHRKADTHCAAKHHHEISKQACSDSS